MFNMMSMKPSPALETNLTSEIVTFKHIPSPFFIWVLVARCISAFITFVSGMILAFLKVLRVIPFRHCRAFGYSNHDILACVSVLPSKFDTFTNILIAYFRRITANSGTILFICAGGVSKLFAAVEAVGVYRRVKTCLWTIFTPSRLQFIRKDFKSLAASFANQLCLFSPVVSGYSSAFRWTVFTFAVFQYRRFNLIHSTANLASLVDCGTHYLIPSNLAFIEGVGLPLGWRSHG